MATRDPKKPRLVTVFKKGRPSFGFNLHGLKGKPGQTVKSVDENGAAYEAGVLPGDRILAVDLASVVGETHSMVVERIRRAAESVTLLLVDEYSYDYCNARGIVIDADNALKLSNEHGPVPRKELDAVLRRVSATSPPPPTSPPASDSASGDGASLTAGAAPLPEKQTTHFFTKRKVSKRDEAKKSKADWAARMAAFDNL